MIKWSLFESYSTFQLIKNISSPESSVAPMILSGSNPFAERVKYWQLYLKGQTLSKPLAFPLYFLSAFLSFFLSPLPDLFSISTMKCCHNIKFCNKKVVQTNWVSPRPLVCVVCFKRLDEIRAVQVLDWLPGAFLKRKKLLFYYRCFFAFWIITLLLWVVEPLQQVLRLSVPALLQLNNQMKWWMIVVIFFSRKFWTSSRAQWLLLSPSRGKPSCKK